MTELRVIWMVKKNKLPTKIFMTVLSFIVGFLFAYLCTRCVAWLEFNADNNKNIVDQVEYADWMFVYIFNAFWAIVFGLGAMFIPASTLVSLWTKEGK